MERGDVVGQTGPGRPSLPDLGPGQDLVGHPLGVHRSGVVVDGDGRSRREEVEATGALDHHLAGVLGQEVPGGVGRLGHPDVAGGVVAEPDDAGVVLAGAPIVTQLELLEADDARPPTGTGPGRGTPERAQPDDHDVGVGVGHTFVTHQRPVPAADVGALVLHGGEPAVGVGPGAHPPLDPLTGQPVLAVDAVPERDGVGGVEPRPVDLVGGEEELPDHPGPPRPERRQHQGGDVLGGQRQQQVGVDQLALVAHPLVVVEVGERRPLGGPALGEGPGPLPVGYAALPVKVPTAPEGGHQVAQLGVDRAAVVALVEVLGDDLPVGGDVVDLGRASSQVGQRVAPHALGDGAELVGQGRRLVRREVHEDPAAPGVHAHRVEPEGVAVEPLHEGGPPQATVEAVAPGVVRTADAARDVAGAGGSVGGGVHQRRAPVAAQVVEAPQGPVLVPDQEDRLPGHVHREEVPGTIDVLGAGHDEPLAGEEPFPLLSPDRVVDVGGPGQRLLETRPVGHRGDARYRPACVETSKAGPTRPGSRWPTGSGWPRPWCCRPATGRGRPSSRPCPTARTTSRCPTGASTSGWPTRAGSPWPGWTCGARGPRRASPPTSTRPRSSRTSPR